jgi:predicted permease
MKLLILLVSALVPREHRARWREEWLGELDVVSARGSAQALRFSLGAPRDAWAMRPSRKLFSALATDVKYATRQLLRRPAYTLAVIACLVVGLVASVGMFSFITSIFYGDMPGIAQRRELLRVYLSYDQAADVETTARGGRTIQRATEPLSFSDFDAIRRAGPMPAIDVIGAEGNIQPLTAAANHGPVSVNGAFASGDLFRALRTVPEAGRLIADADDRPDAPPVAVIADHFWRTQMDGRPDAVGQQVLVSGLSFTVIGVAPPRFHGMRTLDLGEDDSHGVQIWVPLAHAAQWPAHEPIDQPWLATVARLTPGSTIDNVEQQLSVPAARIAAASPNSRTGAAPFVRTMGLGPTSSVQILVIVAAMLALPMIILAIGCANVANLQLARAAEQSRELAVRLALGATRAQLARMLTVETLARVLIAVVTSIGLVLVLLRVAAPLVPVFISLDWFVASFALALTVAVALATGLMPAWLVLRKTAAGQLKQTAQNGGLGHSRLRGGLVVAQVAMSLTLLVLAGLFMRTAQTMLADAPAALREQMIANFNPSELGMSPAAAREFADTVASRAQRDSRVTTVALETARSVRITPPSATSKDLLAEDHGITSSWVDVMQARVLTGRRLTANDDASVVMISAHTAELVAPDGSALGKMLRLNAANTAERQVRVVGIVADIPTRPTVERPGPVIYSMFPATLASPFTLRVRASNPEAVRPDLMQLINAVDPRIAWTSIRRGDMAFEDDARDMQFAVFGAGLAALIALLLSATGLYAVMSYVVQLRRREIGVRVAIGAQPSRIVALMLRRAFRLVGLGAGAGLMLSVPMAYLMRANFVARVTALDPLVFAPTVAMLMIIGGAAAIVPSLRAARVDPIATLRQD